MSDSSTLFDALAIALADIRARFGEAGFADRRRLISLLADKVPEAKREIRAVGTAVDEGVPAALAGSARHLLGMEIDRLSDRLETSTGLRLDIARPIVRAFAFAMDLGPLPSVYVASVPVQPVPTPAPNWAGLSEPVPPSPATPQPVPLYRPVAVNDAGGAAPTSDTFAIGGVSVPRKHAFAGLAAIVLVVGGVQFMGGSTPVPGPNDVPGNATTAQSGSFADEDRDYGVAAQATLQANVGSATPLTIPVGKRLTTAELQALLAQNKSTVLIDVLDNQHPRTIANALFMPFVGAPGTLTDQIQPMVEQTLAKIVADDPQRPLVFFCAGSQCWESYNAVLRANAAKIRNPYWYRGGLASWEAARLPMQATPPLTNTAPTR